MTLGASGTAADPPGSIPDRAWTMPWVTSGTEVLLEQLARVDTAAPSALPGWTNGHVAGHVARNADALGRLLAWARTGVETPMYASPAGRAAEIERDAGRARDVQLADVRATAATLADALLDLPTPAWSARVRSARGRSIAATEIPWMRVKEVWLHALDLGAATSAVPSEIGSAMFVDVVGGLAARADVPGLRLQPEDVPEVVIGDGATVVAGPTIALLAWLVGRSDGADLSCSAPLPPLPAWL